MAGEGRYIYCVIGTDQERNFGLMGIGGRGDEVYTLCYQGQAAVISNSPVTQYPISRENILAHQRVMERVMGDYTVLPVRFGTIAESKDGVSAEQRIKEKVLRGRYKELEGLLQTMENKVELGVKALWADMSLIFGEIIQENKEIRILKKKIEARPPLQTRDERIALGEMVQSRLEAKREKEGKALLTALKKIAADYRTNKPLGDRMIMNAAFLVNTDAMEDFDNQVNKLAAEGQERIKLKYVGPVPPCNFVDLTVTWE